MRPCTRIWFCRCACQLFGNVRFIDDFADHPFEQVFQRYEPHMTPPNSFTTIAM